MKKQPTTFISRALPRLFKNACTAGLLPAILLLNIATSQAGSAKWRKNPGSGDWNTATNWKPATVPNGAADAARFAISGTTGISLSANTEVNSIQFKSGASAFTITAPPLLTLTISGVGITNNSRTTQNFVTTFDGVSNHGTINFTNSATAGSLTAFTNNGQALGGFDDGGIQFFDSASAASGTFTNNAATDTATFGGRTRFFGSSTAANGTFINNSGIVSGAISGATFFFGTSTAANGIFINHAALVAGAEEGFTSFSDTSTAGNATFTNPGSTVSGAAGGFIQILVSSTAGDGIFINNGGAVDGALGGTIFIRDTSTAGNGTFTNNGGTASGAGGALTEFLTAATAGNGIFTANGGAVSGASSARIIFFETCSGGDGSFTTNGGAVSGAPGGNVLFDQSSQASAATLIANGGSNGGDGGTIQFASDSTGDTARVEIFGNGNLDISLHNAPGVTLGSIEGSGVVFLGANNLTPGSNNLSTSFSGALQDGGVNGGTGGSLTKIGTGTLTLTGANSYTGATVVNGGTLGGTGTIAGTVTVGTGSSSGVFLAPGDNGPGTFTILQTLTFNSDATYNFELDSSAATADKVVANGVTINGGALFSFIALGSGALTPGTVFTVIDNTAATPIGGTFSNLPNGSIFTAGGNTFKASYHGGTGNDLTLRVQ